MAENLEAGSYRPKRKKRKQRRNATDDQDMERDANFPVIPDEAEIEIIGPGTDR